MKTWITALRLFLFLTLLTGIVYPSLVTLLAEVGFKSEAHGSIVARGGQALGSVLVAQSFEGPKYFWGRPSGVGYNPLPSGGSNQSQMSAALKKDFDDRLSKLKNAHPDAGQPPQDLLFASASGLDPHISVEAAKIQVTRVSKERGLKVAQVEKIVDEASEARQFGFLGERRVNVLLLNLALDQAQGINEAPVYVPTPTPAPAATPQSSSVQ